MTDSNTTTQRLEIATGATDKPVASKELRRALAASGYSGQLLIGYPVLPTPIGPLTIDATFISRALGVVVFDLVEGTSLGKHSERQDDAYNKLYSRLAGSRELVERRTLLVPINTVSFAPAIEDPDAVAVNEGDVCNAVTLKQYLDGLPRATYGSDVYRAAVSVLGNVATIRRTRPRPEAPEGSRAEKLTKLELSISTLDRIQTRAFLETVDGVQRIRGLAGSGKTIVLARKAAYLHASHPTWDIAVTFNTRSLRAHFRSLITSFAIAESGAEPDWERLRVLPAWGAPGDPERWGLYFEFCVTNGLNYMNYGDAKREFGFEGAFEGACSAALAAVSAPKPLYDAVLVDEAQDLPKEFLRIAYETLKEPRRLVYAYDELQTLNGAGVPPVAEIFGTDSSGRPRVMFRTGDDSPLQDVILEKCYRNSRPILSSAHALGFGIYREPPANSRTGIVQMFDRPSLWRDIGYRLVTGSLEPGANVTLARTAETSPTFLEQHSSTSDLITFGFFDSKRDQDRWVAEQIGANLDRDGLRHDDIVVINTDPLTTANNLGPLRRMLLEMGVQSHLAGVDTEPDVFFKTNNASVTFTGVYRAKGNEAAMVYVVNAEEAQGRTHNLARIRNRLFTAMTRSKAWVRVVGVGPGMEALTAEYNKVQANNYQLSFRYPTEEELKRIATLHRDMDPHEEEEQRGDQLRTKRLIESLLAGDVVLEELDPELQELLRPLLRSHDGP